MFVVSFWVCLVLFAIHLVGCFYRVIDCVSRCKINYFNTINLYPFIRLKSSYLLGIHSYVASRVLATHGRAAIESGPSFLSVQFWWFIFVCGQRVKNCWLASETAQTMGLLLVNMEERG